MLTTLRSSRARFIFVFLFAFSLVATLKARNPFHTSLPIRLKALLHAKEDPNALALSPLLSLLPSLLLRLHKGLSLVSDKTPDTKRKKSRVFGALRFKNVA
jgi:hypothetical protein